MQWSLLVNGAHHSDLESIERPFPREFPIQIRTAVQYEVMPMQTETERVLAEITAKVNSRSDAVFSSCRLYRYFLVRNWRNQSLLDDQSERASQIVAFIGVNGSMANETEPDNTVTRCINYAKSWGFGGYIMLNAFGFMETDPEVMKKHTDPNGPSNDAALKLGVGLASVVVAAWGGNGLHLGRHQQLIDMLPNHCDLHCLGLNGDGTPAHPLYLKKTLVPRLWIPRKSS